MTLLERACRGERTERPPVWLLRQAGRYQETYRTIRKRASLLDICQTPALATQVTLDAVDQIGVDAAIIFSDLLLPLMPLGQSLSYPERGGPRLTPTLTPDDVSRLPPVNVDESLGYVGDAVKLTRAGLSKNLSLIGFAGAPFTLAAYMIEGGSPGNFVKTKIFMRNHPNEWDALLSRLASVAKDLLLMQAQAGADVLQLFDSWAGALSPTDYLAFAKPYTQQVFEGLPKEIPTIHFGTQTAGLLPLLKDTGAAVVGLDWRVNLAEARRIFKTTPVMGNLDPTVLFGPRDTLQKEAQRIIREGGPQGFVFNLGHGVLPETPLDQVVCLVETVKAWRW